jgi:hypothetical protein
MGLAQEQCSCKVGRTVEAFGLSEVNDELAVRRSGRAGDVESLRDLADYFNRSVLLEAMVDAGMSPLEGEVENVYRLLTDDDVSEGMRVRTRNRLEREGVDLDAVESSFVSHPTMGNHLRDCLDVEPSTSSRDPVETARERIFKMVTRTERVVENTLDGLAASGHVVAGTLAVTVDVQVVCEDCGAHGSVSSFVAGGGCDCEHDE